jgi:hypothetical protein
MTSDNGISAFAKKVQKKKNFKAIQNVAARDNEEEKPPSMERSRAQLATTYAPGSLFTWEGGKGICESVSLKNPYDIKDHNQRKQIFLGIEESVSRWLERGRTLQGVSPAMCVEAESFLDEKGQVLIDRQAKFELTRPDKIGYLPSPLLYQCRKCSKIIEYNDIGEQVRFGLPEKCADGTSEHLSNWNQVDVIFVHWSGTWAPLSPLGYDWNPEKGVFRFSACKCGGTEFDLNNKASTFNQWKFVCRSCKVEKDLTQTDRFTREQFGADMKPNGTHEYAEVNMLPVSYRASSAYYVQSNRFIKFDDDKVINLFQPSQKQILMKEIANIYGFEIDEPPIEKLKEQVEKAGLSHEFVTFEESIKGYEELMKLNLKEPAKKVLETANNIKRDWFNKGIIEGAEPKSALLKRNIDRSSLFAKKFDPFRLSIEHSILSKKLTSDSLQGVDALKPDAQLFDNEGNFDASKLYEKKMRSWYSSLGIEKMVVLRKLPICEYSFGYTRVSSQPIYERTYGNNSVNVPVRLRAFPSFDSSRQRPVYVMDQENEAIYVKLNENVLREWLRLNEVSDIPAKSVLPGLSGTYLEQYDDFGQFLEPFKKKVAQRSYPRNVVSMTYLLLHSMAHHFIHALAEHSGLDLDGVSEYIFPADFAFIIYRKGMTQDLGNISSMWRNNLDAFFGQLLNPRTLRCSSGSLCDERGGACPGCLMIPEISCLTGNELLSRAALAGGIAPGWEGREPKPKNLVGYFEVARGTNADAGA